MCLQSLKRKKSYYITLTKADEVQTIGKVNFSNMAVTLSWAIAIALFKYQHQQI